MTAPLKQVACVRLIQERARQRGAAFVEFAVVLPFLMLLGVGTIEIGTAFMRLDTLNKQARNGARYLTDNAVFGSTGVIVMDARFDALVAETRNLVVYGTTVGGGSPVIPALAVDDVSVEQAGLASHLAIRVEYAHTLILGPALDALMTVTGLEFPATLPLTASVVMPVP